MLKPITIAQHLQTCKGTAPNIVIWNDGGDRADLRWVGTESGYVPGETNWSFLNKTGDVPENIFAVWCGERRHMG